MCLEQSVAGISTSRARAIMAHCVERISAIGGVSVIPATRTADDPRFSPHVIQFTNRGIPGEVLVRALSDKGIYISTGSAMLSKKKTRPVTGCDCTYRQTRSETRFVSRQAGKRPSKTSTRS
jgi:cysteine desulfurase